MAGYSGTPLAKKLGFKAPLTVLTIDAPAGYRGWLEGLDPGVTFTTRTPRALAAAHVFVTRAAKLRQHVERLRRTLDEAGFAWISWPKQASGVATDVTEDTIREVALSLGFVDVKVCAVNDVWSGLKLMVRRTERRG
ncbi:MAG TPA: hypothetical protein VH040_05770 [Usitatibacter sp.]|nr:hypothetical protein [Usitatibacter sp.]